MEEITSLFGVLILRIGLPVGMTAVIVWLLKRLDTHWQEEAPLPEILAPAGTPCWERHNCPPEKRATCAAYLNPKVPCWQMYRQPDGVLREGCIGCDVFREAPIPAYS